MAPEAIRKSGSGTDRPTAGSEAHLQPVANAEKEEIALQDILEALPDLST